MVGHPIRSRVLMKRPPAIFVGRVEVYMPSLVDRITRMATTDPSRVVLRQLAATLAYRAAKVLRDVPDGFSHRAFGSATRQPVRIVAHLADLMAWGVSMAGGGKEWKAEGSDDWQTEV